MPVEFLVKTSPFVPNTKWDKNDIVDFASTKWVLDPDHTDPDTDPPLIPIAPEWGKQQSKEVWTAAGNDPADFPGNFVVVRVTDLTTEDNDPNLPPGGNFTLMSRSGLVGMLQNDSVGQLKTYQIIRKRFWTYKESEQGPARQILYDARDVIVGDWNTMRELIKHKDTGARPDD